MTKLVLPKRLQKRFPQTAKAPEKPKEPEKPKIPSETQLDRMPNPLGWRILLLPYKGTGKTEGGVLLPDSHVEREGVATVCGYVLKVGPLAYRDKEKFGENYDPWCKPKDWVIFGRYAGSRFKIEGGEVRLLNDDEILATIKNPEDILHT